MINPNVLLTYALTIYGYTNNISKSNNRKSKAKMKKDMLNSLLFWPKNEWKPHSNTLFFSSYGLWGAKIRFSDNSIIANKGMNKKKKVWEDIMI